MTLVPSAGRKSLYAQQEQLPLFAVNSSPQPSPSTQGMHNKR